MRSTLGAVSVRAPRPLFAGECVLSKHLKCSTPRFDRSGGPSLAAREGARSVIAVSHRNCSRAGDLEPSIADRFPRIRHISHGCAAALNAATHDRLLTAGPPRQS